MKNFIQILVFIFTTFSISSTQAAHSQQKTTAPTPMLELRSKLLGTWEGTSLEQKDMGSKAVHLKVIYESTAGGTAMVERLFPGAENEMTSVYHTENGKISMTHYSMVGKHAKLQLKNTEPNQYIFEFVPTPGINPKVDDYMGGAQIDFHQGQRTQTRVDAFQGREIHRSSRLYLLKEELNLIL